MKQEIRRLIEALSPFDGLEAEHRDDLLSWLDSGVEIFRTAKPATPPKHLVSYCVLVDRRCDHALLVDHRDAQRWLPPGGHVEPGEHPADTARREIEEELGISPPFHREVGDAPLFVSIIETAGRSERHTDVSLWFVFEASTDVELTVDEGEFVGVRWWPVNTIGPGQNEPPAPNRPPLDPHPPRFDPHLPRFLAKLHRHASR